MENCMYNVLTVWFYHGDERDIVYDSASLAPRHSTCAGPPVRAGFLCAASAARKRLYAGARFDLSCGHALALAENDQIGAATLARLLSPDGTAAPRRRHAGRLDAGAGQAGPSAALARASAAGLRRFGAAPAQSPGGVRAFWPGGRAESSRSHWHGVCAGALERALRFAQSPGVGRAAGSGPARGSGAGAGPIGAGGKERCADLGSRLHRFCADGPNPRARGSFYRALLDRFLPAGPVHVQSQSWRPEPDGAVGGGAGSMGGFGAPGVAAAVDGAVGQRALARRAVGSAGDLVAGTVALSDAGIFASLSLALAARDVSSNAQRAFGFGELERTDRGSRAAGCAGGGAGFQLGELVEPARPGGVACRPRATAISGAGQSRRQLPRPEGTDARSALKRPSHRRSAVGTAGLDAKQSGDSATESKSSPARVLALPIVPSPTPRPKNGFLILPSCNLLN